MFVILTYLLFLQNNRNCKMYITRESSLDGGLPTKLAEFLRRMKNLMDLVIWTAIESLVNFSCDVVYAIVI